MKTSFFVWPIFLKFDLVFNTGVYQITKLSLMQGQIEEPGSFLTCLFVLNALYTFFFTSTSCFVMANPRKEKWEINLGIFS